MRAAVRDACECGRSLQPGRRACASCDWLDGQSSTEYRIIDGLRRLPGWATARDVADAGGICVETVRRNVRRLVERGRVRERRDGAGAPLYRLLVGRS